jgi:hypothetical protein
MLRCAPQPVVFIYGSYLEEIQTFQNPPSISHLQLLLSRLMESRLNYVFGIAFFNCQITLYVLPPSKDLETVPGFIFHSTKQKLSSPLSTTFRNWNPSHGFRILWPVVVSR